MKPTVLTTGPLLLAGSLVLAVSTTASPQGFKISKPEIVFDDQVDFSAYQTYAWKESQEPLPNRANHMALTFAVEGELTAKGLEKVSAAEARLFVRYHVTVEKKTKSTGYSGGSSVDSYNVRTMFRMDKVEKGTLILELYEAGTRTLIWQARQTEPIRDKENAERQIRPLVKRMMAAYPPKRAE